MSDVTHLSDNFYEEFAAITTRLQSQMTWAQYEVFYNYLHDKKLDEATRFLERLLKQQDRHINKTALTLLRKHARTWHDFYRDVVSIVDDFEQRVATVSDWNELIEKNGGPRWTSRLARSEGRELPAPPLPC